MASVGLGAGPGLARPRLSATALRRLIGLVAPLLTLAVPLAAGERGSELAIGAVVAAAVVAWAARRPGAALGVVIVFVPVQIAVLAWLYKLGVPEGVVRNLGFVKEGMVLGIVLASLRRQRVWSRVDGLDVLALIYVGVAAAYFLIPFLAPGSLGGNPTIVRLTAWRLDCLFLVLFLAVRRLSYADRVVARLRAAALAVGALFGGLALWESLGTASYNRFMVHTLAVPAYKVAVLKAPGVPLNTVIDHGVLGGHTFVRIGGLLTDPLALGFFALIPLGLGLERLSVNRFRFRWVAAAALAAVTVVLTITRSAVLGGVAAVLLSLTVGVTGTRQHGRRRLAVALVLVALVLAPFAASSSLRVRLGSLVSTTSNSDNAEHSQALSNAFQRLATAPAGLGLGANPATGTLYGTANVTFAEDSYLQIGNELGVVPMLSFTALLIGLLAVLRRRARSATSVRDSLAAGVWLAGVGLFIAGFFLDVWESFAVALCFWGLAGVALQSDAAGQQPVAGDRPVSR